MHECQEVKPNIPCKVPGPVWCGGRQAKSGGGCGREVVVQVWWGQAARGREPTCSLSMMSAEGMLPGVVSFFRGNHHGSGVCSGDMCIIELKGFWGIGPQVRRASKAGGGGGEKACCGKANILEGESRIEGGAVACGAGGTYE